MGLGMSKAAPDTEAEAESGPTTTELSPGLEDVRADVRTTLAKIDDHGEHIKEAVGRCFIGGGVDQEAAREIQALLAKQLGEVGEEHPHVSLPEIIAALWMELYRASGMLVGEDDGEEEQADDEAEDPEEAAAETDEEANAGSLGELFGDDDEATNGDAAEAPVDPAFQ